VGDCACVNACRQVARSSCLRCRMLLYEPIQAGRMWLQSVYLCTALANLYTHMYHTRGLVCADYEFLIGVVAGQVQSVRACEYP
jgi:hypothetical protein